MLLIDGDEAEMSEDRTLLHQSVRPNDEHGIAPGEFFRSGFAFARTKTACQEHGLDSEWLEQFGEGPDVLLREKLCRRHDGSLIPVLHRQQRREEGDDGLPAADIALQQAVHLPIAGHVGHDLAYGDRLRVGEGERQHILECAR